jgi:hypothetical protein
MRTVFESRQGSDVSLCHHVQTGADHPIQWIQGLFPLRKNDRSLKLAARLHLLQGLGMHGVVHWVNTTYFTNPMY